MATVAARKTDITNRLDDLATDWSNMKTDITNNSIPDPAQETYLSALEFTIYAIEVLIMDLDAEIGGGGGAISRTKAT